MEDLNPENDLSKPNHVHRPELFLVPNIGETSDVEEIKQTSIKEKLGVSAVGGYVVGLLTDRFLVMFEATKEYSLPAGVALGILSTAASYRGYSRFKKNQAGSIPDSDLSP